MALIAAVTHVQAALPSVANTLAVFRTGTLSFTHADEAVSCAKARLTVMSPKFLPTAFSQLPPAPYAT